jgi:hypothetical protein
MPDQDVMEEIVVEDGAAVSEAEAPAARPARRPAVRRPAPPPALRTYQRGRSLSGIAIIGLIFGAAWLLNGYFTAQIIVDLGGSWRLGAATHLVTTVIELTTVFVTPALRRVRAPGWVHLVIWAIVLPFGTLDTLTSALGFIAWGLAWGVPIGLSLHVSTTGLALIIAFLPEPMLVWLTAALLRVIRR